VSQTEAPVDPHPPAARGLGRWTRRRLSLLAGAVFVAVVVLTSHPAGGSPTTLTGWARLAPGGIAVVSTTDAHVVSGQHFPVQRVRWRGVDGVWHDDGGTCLDDGAVHRVQLGVLGGVHVVWLHCLT